MMIKTKLPLCYVSCVALLLMCGCRTETDVTADPRFRDGWTPGGQYVLLRDAFITPFGSIAPTPPAAGGWLSVAQWKADPKSYEHYVTAPIYAGTHFRLVRLTLLNSFEVGGVRAYARILDGEYAGRVVDLNGVTKLPLPTSDLPLIASLDPEYMRLVSPKD